MRGRGQGKNGLVVSEGDKGEARGRNGRSGVATGRRDGSLGDVWAWDAGRLGTTQDMHFKKYKTRYALSSRGNFGGHLCARHGLPICPTHLPYRSVLPISPTHQSYPSIPSYPSVLPISPTHQSHLEGHLRAGLGQRLRPHGAHSLARHDLRRVILVQRLVQDRQHLKR